jgi:hypothetical protein
MQHHNHINDSNGMLLQQAAQQRSQGVTAEASRGASMCQCLKSCTNEPEECWSLAVSSFMAASTRALAVSLTAAAAGSNNTLLRLDAETVLTCIIDIVSDAYLGMLRCGSLQ